MKSLINLQEKSLDIFIAFYSKHRTNYLSIFFQQFQEEACKERFSKLALFIWMDEARF